MDRTPCRTSCRRPALTCLALASLVGSAVAQGSDADRDGGDPGRRAADAYDPSGWPTRGEGDGLTWEASPFLGGDAYVPFDPYEPRFEGSYAPYDSYDYRYEAATPLGARGSGQRGDEPLEYGRHFQWDVERQGWVEEVGYFDPDLAFRTRPSWTPTSSGSERGGEPAGAGRGSARSDGGSRASSERRGSGGGTSSAPGGRRHGADRMGGTVEAFRPVSLEGQQGPHTLVRLRLQDGLVGLVDLGPDANPDELGLEAGADVLVRGRRGTIDGVPVLMASSLRVDGDRERLQAARRHADADARPAEASAPGRGASRRAYEYDRDGQPGASGRRVDEYERAGARGGADQGRSQRGWTVVEATAWTERGEYGELRPIDSGS